MKFQNYVTKCGASCLTACINNILLSKGYNSSEEDLVCCDYILSIDCKTDSDAVFSHIFDMIKDTGKYHRMDIKEIQGGNIIELLKRITRDNIALLNVDCRYLNYSDIFLKTQSEQHFHYINVLDVKDNSYFISDGYIPTTPATYYEGWIVLDNKVFNLCHIYTLDIKRLIPWTEDERVKCILKSIDNYFIENNNMLMFNKFISNIYQLTNENNKNVIKKVLFEMATTIGVGGTSASRVYFGNLLLKTQYFMQKRDFISKHISDLLKEYTRLRLLLLKCTYTLSNYDFDSLIRKIEIIQQKEIFLFSSL